MEQHASNSSTIKQIISDIGFLNNINSTNQNTTSCSSINQQEPIIPNPNSNDIISEFFTYRQPTFDSDFTSDDIINEFVTDKQPRKSNSISDDIIRKFVTNEQPRNSNSTSDDITNNKESNLPNTSRNMDEIFPSIHNKSKRKRRDPNHTKTNKNTRDRSFENSFENPKKKDEETKTTSKRILNCCENTKIFQQIKDKPFKQFEYNRLPYAKTLKSILLKHKINKYKTMYC